MLVNSRLAPLVRNSNSGTFAADVVRMRENEAERLRAFREDHHFDHFAQEVRPAIARRL